MSLATASATLTRATRFLGAGLSSAPVDAPRPIAGVNRAKVMANALRELDRFLNLMIDEVAAATAPPGLDRTALARQRNTPNKLRTLHTALGLESPDHATLRAIGRTRDCLFYTSGIVDPRVVWQGARYGCGETLRITPHDLAEICRIYDRIAHELIATCAASRAG